MRQEAEMEEEKKVDGQAVENDGVMALINIMALMASLCLAAGGRWSTMHPRVFTTLFVLCAPLGWALSDLKQVWTNMRNLKERADVVFGAAAGWGVACSWMGGVIGAVKLPGLPYGSEGGLLSWMHLTAFHFSVSGFAMWMLVWIFSVMYLFLGPDVRRSPKHEEDGEMQLLALKWSVPFCFVTVAHIIVKWTVARYRQLPPSSVKSFIHWVVNGAWKLIKWFVRGLRACFEWFLLVLAALLLRLTGFVFRPYPARVTTFLTMVALCALAFRVFGIRSGSWRAFPLFSLVLALQMLWGVKFHARLNEWADRVDPTQPRPSRPTT